MKKSILGLAVAFGLGLGVAGCASVSSDLQIISGTSVTPNQVYVVGNAFVAAEATATQYDQLPPCPTGTNICRTPAGVRAVDVAIRTARNAVSAMEAYTTANPGSVVPVGLYNTAVVAITALQSAITQYYVKS
jgi:hypothetical protein